MKKIIYIFLLAVLPLMAATMLCGCHSSSKDQGAKSSMTDFESGLTNQDSVAVVSLINQFFGYAENEDYSSAAAMLYRPDSDDAYGEPRVLTNEEMEDIKFMLRTVPVYEHRIDYLKFSRSYRNEVKVTAVIRPKSADLPEATTCFYFNPVNYLGNWVLCTISTNLGDRTIVSGDDKDSLTELFREEAQQLGNIESVR